MLEHVHTRVDGRVSGRCDRDHELRKCVDGEPHFRIGDGEVGMGRGVVGCEDCCLYSAFP